MGHVGGRASVENEPLKMRLCKHTAVSIRRISLLSEQEEEEYEAEYREE